jgi:MoaA/NifB/PqqE/SkfB family radical SAM enzyme
MFNEHKMLRNIGEFLENHFFKTTSFHLKGFGDLIKNFYNMRRKNRFYYYYRAIRWGILKEKSPIGAAIKITQRCNLHCKHCPWSNRITKDLSSPTWKGIIDDLYSQGVSVLVIEGGEPTLYKGISGIVDYIKSKGMYCILITNGTQDLSNLNPDVFWISIDGMEKEHDSIRGEGIFSKAIETISMYPEKKFVSLTTLSKNNVDDIEPLVKYFSSSQLLYGMMFHFQYPYAGIEDIALNKSERRKAAASMIELKKKYPKLLNSSSYLKTVGEKKTCYPWLLVVVTSDGLQQHGCMVRHLENEDCIKCDMGCYGELSRAFELKRDTLEFWSNAIGFTKIM